MSRVESYLDIVQTGQGAKIRFLWATCESKGASPDVNAATNTAAIQTALASDGLVTLTTPGTYSVTTLPAPTGSAQLFVGPGVVLTDGSNSYTGPITIAGPTDATAGLTPGLGDSYDVSLAPSSGGAMIRFGTIRKLIWKGLSAITGSGHVGAALDHLIFGAGSAAVPLLVGHESKVEGQATSGTQALVTGYNHQMGPMLAGSTVGTWVGNTVAINNATAGAGGVANAGGTISLGVGYQVNIQNGANNATTVGAWYGYYHPDLSAVANMPAGLLYTSLRRSWQNDDPNAPMVSLAPIIEQCRQYVSGAGNITVTANKTFLMIDVANASVTITLPTTPTDGYEIVICANATQTAVTMATGGGAGFVGAITSLATGAFARYKYDLTTNKYWRVG